MSLLDGQIDASPARRSQVVGDRMTQRASRLWSFILNEYTAFYSDVWNNPDGLTPQQVFDSLGTQAGSFLQWAYGIYEYINTVQPGALNLPPLKPLSINPDGTVTVGA